MPRIQFESDPDLRLIKSQMAMVAGIAAGVLLSGFAVIGIAIWMVLT